MCIHGHRPLVSVRAHHLNVEIVMTSSFVRCMSYIFRFSSARDDYFCECGSCEIGSEVNYAQPVV